MIQKNLLFITTLVLLFLNPSTATSTTTPMLRNMEMHTAMINSIDVDATDERYLVTGSKDKTVRLWSLPEGQLLRILRPPIGEDNEGKIYAVAISPDGETVAAGGWTTGKTGSMSIYLFNRATGELRQDLTGLPNVIFHLAYSPDGRYLVASLAGKNGIRVYDTADYSLQAKDTDYDDSSFWAEFDTQGRLVTSCDDGYIRLYDKHFDLLTKSKAPGSKEPLAVRFSPAGDKIAVGFNDSMQINVLSGKNLQLLYSPDTQGLLNNGDLRRFAWSQDGRWLYAAGTFYKGHLRSIVRWEQAGQGSYDVWPAAANIIMGIRALRDGQIVFGAADPTFGLFDANGQKTGYREMAANTTTNTPILRNTGMHTAKINRIDVDATERYLVTGSKDKTVRVWSLPEEQLLRVLRPSIGEGNEGQIYAVAISPDGKMVAAGGWDKDDSIYLFNRATGELRQRLTGHGNVIRHLAYSPDGRYLVASLGGKNGIRVYDTADYSLQAKDTDYDNDSYWAEFDTQGRLVTGCDDGYIRLYDKHFNLLTKNKAPGGKEPRAVRFSPSGDKIAVGFNDSTQVNVLSGQNLQLLYSPDTQGVDSGTLGQVAWSQDGQWLYAGGRHDKDDLFPIFHWDQAGQGSYDVWPASSNSIMDIRALRDGQIVFGAADPTFGLLDANSSKMWYRKTATSATTNTPILRLNTEMHTVDIGRIDVNATDERYLVTGSKDKTVRVWSLPEGQLLRVLRPPIGEGNEGKINAVAISPNGETVAAGGWTTDKTGDMSVYLFNRATGELRQRLTGLPNAIINLAYSPDGRYLVVSFVGKNGIRVYDTADYSLQAEDTDYGDGSYWAEFDVQGRLVTSCWDGYIRLYDKHFKLLTKKKALEGKRPFTVSFSPTGDKIAVGFYDSTQVKVLSGQNLQLLYSPDISGVDNGDLSNVAWSQDGHWLYAGGGYHKGYLRSILRWEQAGEGSYDVWPAAANGIMGILALRDGQIVFGASDPAFGLLDANGKKTRYREAEITNYNGVRDSLFISKDGSTVQFGFEYAGKRSARFSVNERTLTFDPSTQSNLSLPRTSGINISDWKSTGYPKLNDKPLSLKSNETSRSLAIAPDKQNFLLGTEWSLRYFDKQGRLRGAVSMPGVAWGVNIAENGKVAVAALADGTLRWYRLRDGQELLALFVHRDGQRWIIWTPQGYYDTSIGGEELIGWHLNRGPEQAADFFPAARFREQFYRPDVISKVMETLDLEKAMRLVRGDIGKQHVQGHIQKVLPPIVAMLALDECASLADSNTDSQGEKCSPKAGKDSRGVSDMASRGVSDMASRGVSDMASRGDSVYFSTPEVELRYRIRRPSGQPITTLKVLVDGRPLGTVHDTKEKDKICDSLSQYSSRGVSDLASRGVSDLASRGVSDLASRTVSQNDCQLPQDEQEHRLRVLLPPRDVEVSLIAENQFATSEPFTIRLNWTGEKSEVIKPTLYVLAIGVSNYDDETLTLKYAAQDATDFVDTLKNQQNGDLYKKVIVNLLNDATKEQVISGFNWLKERMTANDVAMLFLAGHGYNSDRQYYFLPRDVKRDNIPQSSVVYHDIKNTVTALPGKTLFLIDTCHSGNVMGGESVNTTGITNDLSSNESGVIVITASTGTELAWENKEWGNGAFTEILVAGLTGGADYKNYIGEQDRKITFTELNLFLQNVSTLTNNKQHPTVTIPKTIVDFAVVSVP